MRASAARRAALSSGVSSSQYPASSSLRSISAAASGSGSPKSWMYSSMARRARSSCAASLAAFASHADSDMPSISAAARACLAVSSSSEMLIFSTVIVTSNMAGIEHGSTAVAQCP